MIDADEPRRGQIAMRIMDLRQLEYFLRAAQRRNMSLAAAELNVTQPTLTKSMKFGRRQRVLPTPSNLLNWFDPAARGRA
jgi:hypothetical protein